MVYWFKVIDPHKKYFDFPLPESAELKHFEGQRVGFSDHSNSFIYHSTDEALLELMLGEWELLPTSIQKQHGRHKRPVSFTAISRNAPVWWPSIKELGNIPESYFRVDEQREMYWSVWVDRSSRNVLAKKGRW